MLTGEKLVHYLFRVENFQCYTVLHPRENRHWTRLIKRTSWCDYQANGKTTVYLEEGNMSNVEALYAAAHEACHALNFRKHQHYAGYMQRLRRLLRWSVLMVVLSLGESVWQWQLHHVGILLCLFLVLRAYQFLQAYKLDETHVEILTVRLLRKHLHAALAWAGDSRKAEDLFPGVRQETVCYHERIQRAANGFMLLYPALAIGYSLKDLGLFKCY
jgi:hypothetical protein